MKEVNTVWNLVGGHGWKSLTAGLRSILHGVAEFSYHSMIKAAWHEANTLRHYCELPAKRILTHRDYLRVYAARCYKIRGLVEASRKDLQLPLPTLEEWYGSNARDLSPIVQCSLYAPTQSDLDKLLRLDAWLRDVDKTLKTDYKTSFGKISVAKQASLQIKSVPVSHAAVNLIMFGDNIVAVIPWEVLEDYPVDLLIEVVQRRFDLHHRFNKQVKAISQKLGRKSNAKFWANTH